MTSKSSPENEKKSFEYGVRLKEGQELMVNELGDNDYLYLIAPYSSVPTAYEFSVRAEDEIAEGELVKLDRPQIYCVGGVALIGSNGEIRTDILRLDEPLRFGAKGETPDITTLEVRSRLEYYRLDEEAERMEEGQLKDLVKQLEYEQSHLLMDLIAKKEALAARKGHWEEALKIQEAFVMTHLEHFEKPPEERSERLEPLKMVPKDNTPELVVKGFEAIDRVKGECEKLHTDAGEPLKADIVHLQFRLLENATYLEVIRKTTRISLEIS